MVYQISELDRGSWRLEMQEILQRVEALAGGHTGHRSDPRWEPVGTRRTALVFQRSAVACLLVCKFSTKEEAMHEIWEFVQENNG